jgi:hypothetical protein
VDIGDNFFYYKQSHNTLDLMTNPTVAAFAQLTRCDKTYIGWYRRKLQQRMTAI